MKLCRTVTLKKDHELVHAVYPLAVVEGALVQPLAGPCKLSFDSYRFAAMAEERNAPCFNHHLLDNYHLRWSVLMVDNVDQKPLFAHQSDSRALLLACEIIDGLFEGFRAFDLTLMRVAPNKRNGALMLDYSIERGSSPHQVIGAAMCLSTLIDSLLFVRGLTISCSELVILNQANVAPSDFFNLYRFIVTSHHEDSLRDISVP